MVQWRESRSLGVPARSAFDLVADVESYPEFLPMWQRAEIVARSAGGYETIQTVGIGVLAQRFRTRTTVDRPRQIVIRSDDGLFRTLLLRWAFRPEGKARCRIDFALDCEIAAWWLKPTLEAMMASTAKSMIDAFERRALALTAGGRRAA